MRIRWPYSYDETVKPFSCKNEESSVIPQNEVLFDDFEDCNQNIEI